MYNPLQQSETKSKYIGTKQLGNNIGMGLFGGGCVCVNLPFQLHLHLLLAVVTSLQGLYLSSAQAGTLDYL